MKKYRNFLYMFLIALAVGIYMSLETDILLQGLAGYTGFAIGVAVAIVIGSIITGGLVYLLYSLISRKPISNATFQKFTGAAFWLFLIIAITSFSHIN